MAKQKITRKRKDETPIDICTFFKDGKCMAYFCTTPNVRCGCRNTDGTPKYIMTKEEARKYYQI